MRVRAGVTESSGADTADAEMLARLEDGSPAPSPRRSKRQRRRPRRWTPIFWSCGAFCRRWKDEGALASLRTLVQTESVVERSYDIYGSAHGKEESEHG